MNVESFESKSSLSAEYLEDFVSIKNEMRNLYESLEREIPSAKVGVAFSNRYDDKMLFTGLYSRVV